MTDKKDDLFEPEDGLFDKSGAEKPFKEEPVLLDSEASSNPSFVTDGFKESKAASGKAGSKKSSTPMDSGKKKKLKIAGIAGAVVIALVGATVMNLSGPAPKSKSTTAKSQPSSQQASGEIAAVQDPSATPDAAQIADPFATNGQAESGAAVADQFAQGQMPAADPFIDPFADPNAPAGTQANATGLPGDQFVQQDQQFVMPEQTPATDPNAPAQESVYSPLAASGAQAGSTAPTAPAPQAMDATAFNEQMGRQLTALQQDNAQKQSQLNQLREENTRLAKELAAAQSANPAAASSSASNSSEVASLKRQVRNLQAKNAQLQKVAKRSTAELEKVAKGQESDVVIAYRKASGIEVSNKAPALLTVKAISNDLAIVQKGENWHYVKQGDSFDGIFVKSVNPVKGVVVTNQGTFSAQ